MKTCKCVCICGWSLSPMLNYTRFIEIKTRVYFHYSWASSYTYLLAKNKILFMWRWLVADRPSIKILIVFTFFNCLFILLSAFIEASFLCFLCFVYCWIFLPQYEQDQKKKKWRTDIFFFVLFFFFFFFFFCWIRKFFCSILIRNCRCFHVLAEREW